MIQSPSYKKCIEKCAIEIYQNSVIRSGTVLVTGATGLIGQAIIDCLMMMNDLCSTDFWVIAMARGRKQAAEEFRNYYNRKNFKFVACNVNEVLPEMGTIEYAIHAASNSHPIAYSSDPIGTIMTNVIGTENVLEYAWGHQCKRIVFLSSVEIYGEDRWGMGAFREMDCGYLDCNQLRAGYPEGKRLGESLCCAFAALHGMDIVIPRLCRVYGPTMLKNDSKALAQFIKNAVNNENIILKSDGKQFYSYIHVLDAVKAIFCIMNKGKAGEAYNVSSELSNVSLIELAGKLAEIAGTKIVTGMPEKAEKKGYSSATRAVLDNTKLKKMGWKETYDIDSGLLMTVHILRELVDGQVRKLDTT